LSLNLRRDLNLGASTRIAQVLSSIERHETSNMESSTLQTDHIVLSEKGLSSVSTLILGSKSAVLIDPPFLVPDAKAVVEWIKKKTSLPLKAVFVTHHHPDHYCE